MNVVVNCGKWNGSWGKTSRTAQCGAAANIRSNYRL